jgi:hypothetical protein
MQKHIRASEFLDLYLRYHAACENDLAQAALGEFWSCHEAQRLAALAQAFPTFALVRHLFAAETKLTNGCRIAIELAHGEPQLAGVSEELRAFLKCLHSLIARVAVLLNEAGAARGLNSFYDKPAS